MTKNSATIGSPSKSVQSAVVFRVIATIGILTATALDEMLCCCAATLGQISWKRLSNQAYSLAGKASTFMLLDVKHPAHDPGEVYGVVKGHK